MVAVWPPTVPVSTLLDGLSERPEDNRAKFEPEVGTPKFRRRTTVRVDSITFRSLMTAEQYEDLMAFYEDDLAGGTMPFTRAHPRTFEASVEFKFLAPPVPMPQTIDDYYVEISLIRMP